MSRAGPLTRSRSKRAIPVSIKGTHARSRTPPGPSLDVKVPRTFENDDRRSYSGEIVIGLALGSPGQSHLPLLTSDDREVDVSRQVDVSYSSASPRNSADGLGNVCENGAGEYQMKRKGSKWRKFGSLFGKKEVPVKSADLPPFYQLDLVLEQKPPKQCVVQSRADVNALRRKRADSTRSTMQSTFKENEKLLPRRNSSRRKGLRRRRIEEVPKPPYYPSNLAPSMETGALEVLPIGPKQHPFSSLLKVEIPSVELERYSVMFGDLLDTKSLQKSQQPSSSQRQRQSENDTVNSDTQTDLLNLPGNLPKPPQEQRDSTSSRSSRSTSFSLFPSTVRLSGNPSISSGYKPLPTPSPLSRSMTAPSNIPALSRPDIQRNKTQEQNQAIVIIQSPEDGHVASIPHRYDLSSAQSYIPNVSAKDKTSKSRRVSSQNQPNPEITTEESAESDTRDISLQRPFPTRKSSMKKLPLPVISTPAADGARDDGINITAAEVSIARQISISRRQRQLLVPVAPKLARQPMRPTIVNGISTPATRKSHHLLYDGDLDKESVQLFTHRSTEPANVIPAS